MISTPSLNHFTSASSSSHSSLNSTLSSSTTFFPSNPLVNLWGNSRNQFKNKISKWLSIHALFCISRKKTQIMNFYIPPIVTSQVVSSSPSFPNSSILHVYLPVSSTLASLIVSVRFPSSFSIKKFVSDGGMGLPSLYHFTRALGLSTLHLIFNCFFVSPCFFSSNFFLNP